MMDTNKNFDIFYFSGTHWDREWYQPFQGFRLRLVRMLDELIDYLEKNNDFGVFHLDGQTIVLEDYLEVRPEQRLRLEKLIKDGRIMIGPWYCMPDENLVSGESLVRNLVLGTKQSKQWGTKAWGVGYLCDTFGHIAQMPQLLKGIGIQYAFLGRGTNQHTTPPFFNWNSPNGDSVLTYKQPDRSGYGSFSMEVIGQLAREEELAADSDEFAAKASQYIHGEKERANVPVIFVSDAMDHEPMHPQTPAYIERLKQLYPKDTLHHTDLVKAFEKVEASGVQLPIKAGELTEPAKLPGPHLHLLTGVLSSRYSIKKRNDQAQSLLESWLEPVLLLLQNNNISYPAAYRHIAWKHLLQNHPHDSICGCSIDRVHQDMQYRFSQVEEICESILNEGEYALSGGRHILHGEAEEYISMLCPLPYEAEDTVEITIPFAPDYPKWHEPFGYEEICAFRLIDGEGNEVPYAIRKIAPNSNLRVVGDKLVKTDLYTVILRIKRVGLGLTSLKVVPSEKPVRYMGTLAHDYTLENKYVKVQVQSNGRLTIVDKKTGSSYRNLLGLCDDGEIGDGWNSARPAVDKCVTGDQLESVSITVSNPYYSELQVKRVMRIPVAMDGNMRSSAETKLAVTFTIGLGADDRDVDVRVKVENQSQDHRLRLVMPTDVETVVYDANQAFAFVQRKTGVDIATHDWKEKSLLEKAMGGIISVRNNNGCGIAFVSDFGLHEGGVDCDDRTTVFVTLMRGFRKTHTTNGEVCGQELGESTYRFRLCPMDENRQLTELQRVQSSMRTGVRSFVTTRNVEQTLFAIEGNVCVSACKPADDGSGDMIVRIYNAEREPVTAHMNSHKECNWHQCDFLEEQETVLKKCSQRLDLVCQPGQIYTLRVQTAFCENKHPISTGERICL